MIYDSILLSKVWILILVWGWGGFLWVFYFRVRGKGCFLYKLIVGNIFLNLYVIGFNFF